MIISTVGARGLGLAGALTVAGCWSGPPATGGGPAVVEGPGRTVWVCDATSCRIVADERGEAEAEATAAEPEIISDPADPAPGGGSRPPR